MSGALGYHGGLSAEEIAETAYVRAGYEVCARRWRGEGGEIDLICRRDGMLHFIEVKKARSAGAAAARVSLRQQQRILQAAQEYLGQQGLGQDTAMQFDVALVDGAGRIEILAAAFP